MFCVKCGCPIGPDNMFCPKCGHFFTRKKNIVIWPVFIFMVLFTLLAYYNYYQSFANIALDQLAALRNREYSKAFYAFTSDGFREKSELIQFRKFINKHPILVNYRSYEIYDTKTDPSDAKIKILDLQLNSEGSDEIVVFRFERDQLGWKITKIGLEGDYFPYENEDKREIELMIQAQLSAIKNCDIADAYYTYMSREFQNKTSLGSFQETVEYFDPLRNFERVEWLDSKRIEDACVACRAGLRKEGKLFEVLYTAGKENGSWKISAVDFASPEILLSQDPKEIIQSQLAAIRSREMVRAYFEFTSKEFQRSISLQDFKTFLKKQEPFFHHRSLEVHSIKQTNNEALVVATLSSVDNDHLPVEFKLVREGDIWKINHILMN